MCLGKHLKTDGGGGEESHNRIKFGCINKLSTAFNKNNQISHHCNWGLVTVFFSFYKIHLFWSTMAPFLGLCSKHIDLNTRAKKLGTVVKKKKKRLMQENRSVPGKQYLCIQSTVP